MFVAIAPKIMNEIRNVIVILKSGHIPGRYIQTFHSHQLNGLVLLLQPQLRPDRFLNKLAALALTSDGINLRQQIGWQYNSISSKKGGEVRR